MRTLRTNICSRMTFLGRWGHLDNWLSSPNGRSGLSRAPLELGLVLRHCHPGLEKEGGDPQSSRPVAHLLPTLYFLSYQ